MAQEKQNQQVQPRQEATLEGGTYEVIRKRLETHAADLRERIRKLNVDRKSVFGAVENKLLSSERLSTENNCIPRDIISLGNKVLFGYNVFVGLRPETTLADVFAIYQFKDGSFQNQPLDLIDDNRFKADFFNLYKYYRNTRFVKFAIRGHHLFMVFRIGRDVTDIKTFKWLIREDSLKYLDNRSDHEFSFPSQHQFNWTRVTQDMHRSGMHPHISIDDRIFVETVGGDLTIKIEDNTETGEGIYAEPVDDPDQTLSDAQIYYAIVGHLILLKILPYQEEAWRFIVYNEKIQQARRIDSIRDACVLLPEDHGVVFPKGYYLQTGEQKLFDIDMQDMMFERRIASPNGEDYLYIFYNRDSGVYVLLFYNIIEQKMAVPMVCNGYSLFDDGTLLCFRADGEPQKHHVIQIWTTPFYGPDFSIEVKSDSPLYKIGNKSIVRCMAECMELLNLISKEETYLNLYLDINKQAQDIQDAYFWLNEEALYKPIEPLIHIRDAAAAAMDEYEKVVRTRQNTRDQINEVRKEVQTIISGIDYDQLRDINEYVHHLAALRSVRGRIVSLRDLRYADTELIDKLEQEVAEHTETLSGRCVEFLLDPAALDPYQKRAKELGKGIDQLEKVVHCKERLEQVAQTASELEMLTEIVSNLKIEDATQTVSIIDNISAVYSIVNQVKAAVNNRLQSLGKLEGQAEFASQIKLIDQSVINYLDICDTPEKCDEYLTKITVQVETLESRFADYDEFVIQLTEKREELYSAFESRKVQLVAKKNQRASALLAAAERILKGIQNRVQTLTDINAINGYFASDLMVERVRQTIAELTNLGDSVKAEDVKSRLKTLQQETIRQLKDKQALYEDGDNIIRLGKHKFSVNRQQLEGTIVRKDNQMYYHLAGTGYFELIQDEAFQATRDVWDLDLLSESPQIYRAEYLAWQYFLDILQGGLKAVKEWAQLSVNDIASRVQTYMGPRFEEGYIKGVHDHDAARILQTLCQLYAAADLLRYPPRARAAAVFFWQHFCPPEQKTLIARKLQGAGMIRELFDAHDNTVYIKQLRDLLSGFASTLDITDDVLIDLAAEYLFHELCRGETFVISKNAESLCRQMAAHIEKTQYAQKLNACMEALHRDPVSAYQLTRDWVRSYVKGTKDTTLESFIDEAAVALLDRNLNNRQVISQSTTVQVEGIQGAHPSIENNTMQLDYCDFVMRLNQHCHHIVPKFQHYQKRKKQLVDEYADALRLEEFMPRVLTTFVRNKLIDKVYLPLLGDNLAKQIGTAGEQKRTDRQGLLLLISPPGYGKTTLMEYIANRLGLIFMKINGPAIGHQVTSLDPTEAPNAAARQELNKLNLSFEMGDNVMIYVDDIQHTNPEFLQKFISLCDAQRRVEGVYKGRSKTYELRGKRVCVVMAGNPYTESGEKFRIPDMLSNRADVYNIGDIVGDNFNEFVMSYIENSLTSNPVMETLAQRSQADVYAIMKLAQTDQKEGIEFEAQYSVDELNEYVATMKKLFVVRDTVLKVNTQYIKSAAQSDEFRTEPPFLLQGSYRNMNRIASRVLPVMNDSELWTLIYSAYEQDAQTLTTGAESNLLKFNELMGRLNNAQQNRWDDIKKTFNRNKLLGVGDSEDRIGRLMGQLNSFNVGLESIKDAISDGVKNFSAPAKPAEAPVKEQKSEQIEQLGQSVLNRMNDLIEAIRQDKIAEKDEEQRQNAETLTSILEEQFRTMELWLTPVHHSDADRREYFEDLVERFETMRKGYQRLIDALKDKYEPQKKQSAPNKKPQNKTPGKKDPPPA